MTRNGKIARLPFAIRQELNRRLHEGESGRKLLVWLNALPEVRAVLTRDFHGRKISEQNLSEWKSGGYRDWQMRQEALAQARELAAEAGEISAATGGQLADHLATALGARYAIALAGWNGEFTDEFREKLRALRGFCQDIVELRRGDHSGARLKLEQERLDREREKTDEEIFELFKQWANKPQVRDWVCHKWVCPEERDRRLRELFSRKNGPAENGGVGGGENGEAADETGPIKPNQTESK